MSVSYRRLRFFGASAYRVGTDGSVWSCLKIERKGIRKGEKAVRVLTTNWRKLTPSKQGGRYKRKYLIVTLRMDDGKATTFPIHRLVLEAFVGPRPKGLECCHFPDRNPSNNTLENLSWRSKKENHEHQDLHGTRVSGERHGMAKLDWPTVNKIRRLRKRNPVKWCYSRLVEKFGMAKSNIARIVNNQIWKTE